MNIEAMKQRLNSKFTNSKIEVADLTGTANHYQVIIESEAFHGLNRVQQHQLVMSVFKPELTTGELHALALTTKVPN
jgi:stress-induced morphogen